eukprot:IDg18767t1
MERSARTEEAARPTRKQLKAALSRSVPAGGERTVLRDAERALSDAQQLTRTLRRERTALSRQIAVRERKLCDWKVECALPLLCIYDAARLTHAQGKLPYDGAANADAMERALARAGDMPWRRIADVQSAGDNACALTLRNAYVRAAGALAGFGGAWVLCAAATAWCALQHAEFCGCKSGKEGSTCSCRTKCLRTATWWTSSRTSPTATRGRPAARTRATRARHLRAPRGTRAFADAAKALQRHEAECDTVDAEAVTSRRDG